MVGSGMWVRSAVALSLGVGHMSDGKTPSQHVAVVLYRVFLALLHYLAYQNTSRIKVDSFNATVLSV